MSEIVSIRPIPNGSKGAKEFPDFQRKSAGRVLSPKISISNWVNSFYSAENPNPSIDRVLHMDLVGSPAFHTDYQDIKKKEFIYLRRKTLIAGFRQGFYLMG